MKNENLFRCLILFLTLLLLSITASAEIEINTTLLLEDNLVILLDYSGSTIGFREYIQSHAIHSIQNVENNSNVSIVVYGGFIKSTELYRMDNPENRSILEDFVHNLTGKYADAAYNNGDQGFEEARSILNNSTGTRQILLISSGVISEGRKNTTDRIVQKIRELKNDNIKIRLYQVSTTYLTNSSKHLYKSFKYLSDVTNIKAVVLNPEEDIAFIRNETIETLPIESPMSLVIDDDEYLNEFSNYGEKSTLISKIQYDRKGFFSSFSPIHFYSYCNQTCITVPFDIGERKFYDDKETLKDIFVSENAIDLVKSGNVTESAYTFSLGSDFVCGYVGDTFKDESKNFGGEVVPLIAPKTEKAVEILKVTNRISKSNPEMLIMSGLVFIPCSIASNKEEDVFNKIAKGRIYIINMEKGYASKGIVKEFQIYNIDTIQSINEARGNSFVKLHAIIQFISVPFDTLKNCLQSNKCSISKTNMEILDEKYALINDNYARLSQLSNQNYENRAELAIGRINDKTEESKVIMDNATYGLNELNDQIPYQIPYISISSEVIEKIVNFIEEPETNYTMARSKQDNAEYLLENARVNFIMYKFNSAIQNSNDSIAQSREGIIYANIEKSKPRHFRNRAWLFGAIAVLILITVIKKLNR